MIAIVIPCSYRHENEVISIIKKFKNKYSTDCNDMNMMLLKKLTFCIAEPLTFICNLSFQNGIFPSDMKIAKVVPLFKSGEKMYSAIIGQYLYCHNSQKFLKRHLMNVSTILLKNVKF